MDRGSFRMRVGVLVWSFILLVAANLRLAQAAPVDNRDGFWSEWSDATFARAAREKKFVIVSLQSWWCPWCHRMNEQTWANANVRQVLKDRFIPVYVDQDSRPDISHRYEEWGWPATVIFAPDGTEIAKLRGFYSAPFFIPVLTDTIKDPTPVADGRSPAAERGRTLATGLSDAARAKILAFISKSWNQQYGGWSPGKFVDGPTFDWALRQAHAGDRENDQRIRKTLTAMLGMLDPKTGAMSQVNLAEDWSEPAHEYPMFVQESALLAYTRAWKMYGDPAYRQAADRIFGFLKGTMRAPSGGFYASMGLEEGKPGVDKREYARETAQAIAGLLAYYDATGVVEARDLAVAAARWVQSQRALPGGGFRHADRDSAGPYLADNIEVAKAQLALYRSTGDREWLAQARATADFTAKTFIDERTGGFVASASRDARHLSKPVKRREDNVVAVRLYNQLHFYTAQQRYREIAEAGMGYLTSPTILDAYEFLPDVLLAEDELRHEPVHLTVVGPKNDPRAADLYRAALAYPAGYKRIEWWDKSEGKLPNPDVDYPDYSKGPAAFACTSNFCSLPVVDPEKIHAQLDSLQRVVKK